MQLSARKIVYSIFILVLLGFGVFFYRILGWNVKSIFSGDDKYSYVKLDKGDCFGADGKEMNCNKCEKKGVVKMIGWGWICEVPAKDGGKVCVYNDECIRGCRYQSAEQEVGVCGLSNYNNPPTECTRTRGWPVSCPRKGIINLP